jgi:hypothetical protein
VALPLGTLRRRRVRTLASAYDFDALDSALKIQREMAALLRNLA